MNAVTLRNISKMYRIYDKPQYKLKEALIRALFRSQRSYHRAFWALRDINLDIPRGSTIGIIGKNGSGKSTLLQIIAGIIQPTTGTLEISGRISALLELGTGFNPEFTGRENVFMNGAIMGLKREEIEERFEDIAQFADIGDFIDQPVKIYSSGMYVRLAFACAVNVDADILIIDEALSVGDAPFQRKCFNRLNELKIAGKTIIIVSHDLHAIERHCNTGLYLNNGTVVKSGNIIDVLNAYYDDCRESDPVNIEVKKLEDRGSGEASIKQVILLNEEGIQTDSFKTGEKLRVVIFYDTKTVIPLPKFGFSVWGVDPVTNVSFRVFTSNTIIDPFDVDFISGRGYVECLIESLPLLPGKFHIRAGIYDKDGQMPYCLWGWSEMKATFKVLSKEKGGFILKDTLGVIELEGNWKIPDYSIDKFEISKSHTCL